MDNSVKIVLIIMIASVLIVGILGWAWVYSPTEFTINFEVDEATLKITEHMLEVFENQTRYECLLNDALGDGVK